MKKLMNLRLSACLLTAMVALSSTAVLAKLPPLSDEAKAKAAETASKSAWSGKFDSFQLCQSQNKVAAAYQSAAAARGLQIKPPVETPPCLDPGAYVATIAEQPKPIEASGAHSPAETAASPPSTTQPHATIAPAKKP